MLSNHGKIPLFSHNEQKLNEIEKFERVVKTYTNVKGALAVQSGTAAIHLALRLLEVRSGDNVFCSTLTSIASASPIIYQGAEPVFIDSDPDTWNMSPVALKKALDEAVRNHRLPKAIIVTHLYGYCGHLEKIKDLSQTYQVPVIEDAAHAFGTLCNGEYCGSRGDFGIFSFGVNKLLSTSNGGMLLSGDSRYIRDARHLASQARELHPFHHHQTTGYNYQMSPILAAIGNGELGKVVDKINKKRNVYHYYQKLIAKEELLNLIPVQEGIVPNYWMTVITIDDVSIYQLYQVYLHLMKQNIEVSFIVKPLHRQPVFEGYTYFSHSEHFSVSDQLFHTALCVPSGVNMTGEEQEEVIAQLKHALELVDNSSLFTN
ncbi:DegT/DnrJ/EryC1/StrS family aminotransferase [Aquibacillus koreensis]|uniref:DegT/DnrJ/EryC1/StrS family aminotransferase n=1 Tax=Aquibacillus koreensis TaxID=279446 RepID=A0A9X3WK24_9BACI|nr:DegT/DnrJ/EryC1/StrS family aminotransferase [Aquibacillus koreensis]MCT2537764.1 DegT/DnrJ/EryC1/StrS family aminotransferase [Aquibacillus koreensis]MDC3421202.1 DegT/DnrJ/EryC1/StrS family aminotransferase [Aquibacillus koreensis]